VTIAAFKAAVLAGVLELRINQGIQFRSFELQPPSGSVGSVESASELPHVNLVRFFNQAGFPLAGAVGLREALRRCFFSRFPKSGVHLENAFLVVPDLPRLCDLKSELLRTKGRLFVGFDSEKGDEHQGGYAHDGVRVRVVRNYACDGGCSRYKLSFGWKGAHARRLRESRCVAVFHCDRRWVRLPEHGCVPPRPELWAEPSQVPKRPVAQYDGADDSSSCGSGGTSGGDSGATSSSGSDSESEWCHSRDGRVCSDLRLRAGASAPSGGGASVSESASCIGALSGDGAPSGGGASAYDSDWLPPSGNRRVCSGLSSLVSVPDGGVGSACESECDLMMDCDSGACCLCRLSVLHVRRLRP
jgi:hypothetical protein